MSQWYPMMAMLVFFLWVIDGALDGSQMRKNGQLCWWHFRLWSPLFVGTVSGWFLSSLAAGGITSGPMERVWYDLQVPAFAAIAGAFIGLLVEMVILTSKTTDHGRFQFSLQEMLLWFTCVAMLLGALTTCIRELMIPVSY